MKINRDLFLAAAMAMAVPSSPLVGCAASTATGSGAATAEDATDSTGPADERDCSVEDCSDLMNGPADERDCSVEDCSDLTGPSDERDCGVEDCSDLMD